MSSENSPPERWTPWSGSPWPVEETDLMSVFGFVCFFKGIPAQTVGGSCEELRGGEIKLLRAQSHTHRTVFGLFVFSFLRFQAHMTSEDTVLFGNLLSSQPHSSFKLVRK